MSRLFAVAASLAAVACAGSKPSARAESGSSSAHAAAPAPARPGGMMACPMDVPDTTVAAADTADGEAITFTTRSAQIDELRRRVRAMADMHNQHHWAAPAGTEAEHGSTGHGGMEHGGMPMPPPSRAVVEDVDQGARIALTPRDPAQVGELRSAVRMHAEHMQREGCPMMGGPAH